MSDSEPRLRAGQSAVRKIQDGVPFSVSWIPELCPFSPATASPCTEAQMPRLEGLGCRPQRKPGLPGFFSPNSTRARAKDAPWEWREITGEPWEDSQGRQEPKHRTQGCSGQGPA